MGINQKSNPFFIVLGFFILLISCNDNSGFNLYKSIGAKGWKINKKVFFEFDITDTINQKNLFINIRNNNNYEFSNLYLITELSFPNKTKVVDTLQYKMADEVGRFLGSGFTEVKDNKLFYKENKVFPMSGKYNLTIRHAMRKNGEIKAIEFLKGIQDIGFSIENIK